MTLECTLQDIAKSFFPTKSILGCFLDVIVTSLVQQQVNKP